MKLDIKSKYNYQEMCDELGIDYESFLSFIQTGGGNSPSPLKPEIKVLPALEQYTEHLNALLSHEKISINTFKTYTNFLERFKSYITTSYPELMLLELNQVFFLDFLKSVKSNKTINHSNRTYNTYAAIIRAFLNFCYYKDLTHKEYKKNFTFKPVNLKPRYLKDDQVTAFLKEVLQTTYGYLYHAIFSFLLGTGCRVSEVPKLRVCDFDIINNIVHIKGGKGGKDRYIPIYDEVKKIILDYLNLTGVSEWSPRLTGYLFSRDDGTERKKSIGIRSIERMVKVVSNKLKFEENYTVHSWRHTFAVRCLLANMKIEYLSQIMGHTSPETTFIYLQLLPKDLQQHVTDKYPFAFEKLLVSAFGIEDDVL
ncbi:tyrosine-type recombinase/integrase [Paenibacillus wynnii]|uniref:tyrosine-type recombinase/integrase n=1 Tax=Paenibacillus wynnii TaxID=268407 RepID=UPI0027942A79|nr:site-specific integrase [Paenibacillus wynnii]MDQ0194923.1 integrase [Paenibacillus wynnii]